MKKIIIIFLIIAVSTSLGLNNAVAQSNVLSDKFDSKYFLLQEIERQIEGKSIEESIETMTGLIEIINLHIKEMEAKINCAYSIENEYDYIKLYSNNKSERHIEALMSLKETNPDHSEKIMSGIKILKKIQKDYDKFMYDHEFFQSAFRFFKEQIIFSFENDTFSDNYQYYQPNIIFKKNLNDYSPIEIFWILEFGEQFLNCPTLIGVH